MLRWMFTVLLMLLLAVSSSVAQNLPEYAMSQPPVGGLTVNGDLNTAPVIPSFNWNKLGAEVTWYNVVVANAATPGAPLMDEWYEVTEVCGASTCTFDLVDILPAWGLLSADYEVRVGSYDSLTAMVEYTTEPFSVTVPAAELTANLAAQPREGRPRVEWDDDPNTLWVQVWMGPAGANSYFKWVERNGDPNDNTPDFACNTGTCFFLPEWDVPGGEYTAYAQAWGPGGFSTGGSVPNADGWSQSNTIALPTTPPVAPTPMGENSNITWAAAENATWYNLVITTTDFDLLYNEWFLGDGIGCGTLPATCSVNISELNLGIGTYNLYLRAWGPGGFSENPEYAEGMLSFGAS